MNEYRLTHGDLVFSLDMTHYTNKHTSSEHLIHTHQAYEIYYLLNGNLQFLIENNIYSLMPGDVLLINSNELHMPIKDQNTEFEGIKIHFEPSFYNPLSVSVANEDFLAFNLLHCFIHRPKGMQNKVSILPEYSKKILDIFVELEFLNNCDDFGYEYRMFIIFTDLLLCINKAFMNIMDKKVCQAVPNNVVDILNYIEDNLEKEITLDILSSSFFISKYHLSHMFKKTMGISLQEYIISRRISMARELLDKGLSVTNACFLSGFNNHSNFVKLFKKVVGISPLQYRNRYGNKKAKKAYLPIGSEAKNNRIYISKTLPDLTITDLNWSPENPVDGDTVIFYANIKNIGINSTPSNITIGVGFSIDGSSICWSDYHSTQLAPGKSVILSANSGIDGISTWIAKEGSHVITAHVDDMNRILESNKDNNILTKTIIIERKALIHNNKQK